MELMKDKPTESFTKHIDNIALIQNDVFLHLPRKKVDLHYEVSLETYLDELYLRSAICEKTAEDICEILPFSEVKKQFKTAILKLAKEDIGLTEFTKKKEHLEAKLISFAKLEYCKQKFFSGLDLNNDITVASILLTILDKLNKQNKDQSTKQICVSRTKIFKYIKDVSIEENEFDFKPAYEKFSITQMIDILFNAIVLRNYELENSIEETSLGIDKKNYIHTIAVICPEVNENEHFMQYKKELEQEIYDWLIDEMHTLEKGMMF